MAPNSEDELKAIRDLYDREAARYDGVQGSRFMHWLLRDSREEAARHARGHLLNVGIGSGADLALYAPDVRVTGIDISTGMLALARKRLGTLQREAELLEMDAQHLDFPDHTFDSVAFNLTLCTIPDPSLALLEAIRVAKSGAPMTFLEHVRSDNPLVGFPQDALNAIFGRTIHDRINQRTEDLIRAAGIGIDSVERWRSGLMTLMIGRAP